MKGWDDDVGGKAKGGAAGRGISASTQRTSPHTTNKSDLLSSGRLSVPPLLPCVLVETPVALVLLSFSFRSPFVLLLPPTRTGHITAGAIAPNSMMYATH